MKFTTLCAVAVAALAASTTGADASVSPQAHKIMSHDNSRLVMNNLKKFAQNIQRKQSNLLENLADGNKLALQLQKAMDQNRKLNNAQSEKQFDTAIFQFIQGECPDEFNALLNGGFNADALQDLIQCVKDTFIDKLKQCLAEFEGILEPTECIIDLSPEYTFDGGLSDSGGDFGNRQFEDSGSDSSNIFEQKLEEVEDLIEENAKLSEEQCAEIFGTADEPGFFACLNLLDSADWDGFKKALQDNFAGNAACSDFVKLAGLDVSNSDGNLDFVQEFLGEIDFFDDFEFELCSQNVLDDALSNYADVFEQCDKIDGGALQNELQSRFGNPAATITQGVVALLVAGAAMFL